METSARAREPGSPVGTALSAKHGLAQVDGDNGQFRGSLKILHHKPIRRADRDNPGFTWRLRRIQPRRYRTGQPALPRERGGGERTTMADRTRDDLITQA